MCVCVCVCVMHSFQLGDVIQRSATIESIVQNSRWRLSGRKRATLDFLLNIMYCYLRIENVEGYVLIAVYLFIYLFVCVLFV